MRTIPIDRFLDGEDGARTGSAVPNDWHALVAQGRAARAASDGGFWRIGQLALLVERRYRSGALKRFAEEIGDSLGSVRRFRWVAGAYDDTARARFADLSFSHFQAVAGLADRLIWLERAQRGAWSVDRLFTHARADGATPLTPDVKLRKPIESAARSLSRLIESADDRELARAARAGLTDMVDELAEQVDALRARIRTAQARRTSGRARCVPTTASPSSRRPSRSRD